jgi:hypothetical protein
MDFRSFARFSYEPFIPHWDPPMIRHFCVWLHRWAGLAMAGFLVVVGLIGSLLGFDIEIEIERTASIASK